MIARGALGPSLCLLLGLALACGDDGGTPPDASGPCAADTDCEDGIFCNGRETCDPSSADANGRGCVTGGNPCGLGQVCAEAAAVCATDCSVAEDLDGDGSRALICGGTDCDDDDADRFPGNAEVCDPEGVDEDCDPETFGAVDDDDDGYVSSACCNGDTCGRDCDDTRAPVSPEGAEVCNGRDDDCDGNVDEEATTTYYRDDDDDGFGVATDEMEACEPPVGYALRSGDCDDANADVRPNAAELCEPDMVDEDCSGVANDVPGGCACVGSEIRDCLLSGVCHGSDQACQASGVWGACAVQPEAVDTCGDSLDNDCDASIDEGCSCSVSSRLCGIDIGACQRGIQDCLPDGSWGVCRDEVMPAPEVCNGRDDDCDDVIDEGAATVCWADNDNDGYAAPAASSRILGCDVTDCPSGETSVDPTVEDDCDDADGNAFPGQTAYFSSPRSGEGGFDYNCDGLLERGSGPTQPGRGSCPSVEPCNEGVFFTRSNAPCGGYADVLTCYATGDSGSTCGQTSTCSSPPNPTNCPDTSGPPQSCR